MIQALIPTCLSGLHSFWQNSCRWGKTNSYRELGLCVQTRAPLLAGASELLLTDLCFKGLALLLISQQILHSILPLEHDLLILVKTRTKRQHSQPWDLNPADSVSCIPSYTPGNTTFSIVCVVNPCSTTHFCDIPKIPWDRRGSE